MSKVLNALLSFIFYRDDFPAKQGQWPSKQAVTRVGDYSQTTGLAGMAVTEHVTHLDGEA